MSFAKNMMTLGSMQIAANIIGTRKVVMRKDFFFTLVVYSRDMMIPIFLIFIAYSSSVTSLMNMSFILGTSSLNEFTVSP